jgi:hypothetical protein
MKYKIILLSFLGMHIMTSFSQPLLEECIRSVGENKTLYSGIMGLGVSFTMWKSAHREMSELEKDKLVLNNLSLELKKFNNKSDFKAYTGYKGFGAFCLQKSYYGPNDLYKKKESRTGYDFVADATSMGISLRHNLVMSQYQMSFFLDSLVKTDDLNSRARVMSAILHHGWDFNDVNCPYTIESFSDRILKKIARASGYCGCCWRGKRRGQRMEHVKLDEQIKWIAEDIIPTISTEIEDNKVVIASRKQKAIAGAALSASILGISLLIKAYN